MAEIIKKEVDVKESEIISTVEETCFVNIPEDDIKLENTEIQGENIVREFDPLHSEPKPKRIKKCKDGYPCSKCEHTATTARDLKRRVESKHEGVRYPCLKRDYAATQAGHLKFHIESKHDGVRYLCSQCKHSTTTASDLKRHVESKHEGVRYPCSACNFVATRASNLKAHVENKKRSEVSLFSM
ncbi:zinc finger protein 711 [Eurytemora carolleeae]|uniref:zinc finger protein 711 n=1 Tax=Eurytemora carolleeae TaxID=1294199 RepID=UPI000C75D17A|nr:zinc finger protein 711 [Eurytemora carolleeae]|eukprot:XP_023348761.1 zinc finger protein 711-like [Eurytemora affinis]